MKPLLSSRKQTMQALGYESIDPVKELERQGRLRVIRPTGKKRGQVFHPVSDVEAIANGESDAA